MNKYIKHILAVIWLVILSSCETNVIDDSDKVTPGIDFAITETTENYSITYKFNNNVIVLNEKNAPYLIKVENDSILYFSKSIPSNIRPEIGRIISSKISDKTPYGLGNVVIEKSEIDGMIRCVTTVAPLDDIFEELDLVSNFSLADFVTDDRVFYDEEGNRYEFEVKEDDYNYEIDNETRSGHTRTKIGSYKIIEFPIKVKTPSGLFSDFKLQVGGVLTFDKNKSKNTFENSFEVAIGINGELGIKGDTIKKADLIPIAKKLLTLIKRQKIFEGIVPIAGGLITLRPYIDFEANLVGGVNGKASVGFGYRYKYKAGWTEKGFFHGPTSSEPTLSNIFNSFSLKGGVRIGPEVIFHTGCGLHTKDLSMELNIKIPCEFSAELGISGERTDNIFQIQGQSVGMDLFVDLDGKLNGRLFGKNLFNKEVNLVKFNVLNIRTPIFPEIKAGSLNVKKTNDSPLTFEAKYTVTGGAIAKIFGGIPTIRIEEQGKEVYHIVDGQELHFTEPSELCYQLTGLKNETTYTAIPSIIIGDISFDWNGKNFSDDENDAKTKIEILAIRQTGYQPEEHDCNDNCGVKFHHKFNFDVEYRVSGSSNCIECGYCIDYIHDRRGYYHDNNVDGVHNISNTLLFSTDNPTLVIYPYAKYRDGTIEVGEPFKTQFSAGGGTSWAKANAPIQKNLQNIKNVSSLPSPLH